MDNERSMNSIYNQGLVDDDMLKYLMDVKTPKIEPDNFTCMFAKKPKPTEMWKTGVPCKGLQSAYGSHSRGFSHE